MSHPLRPMGRQKSPKILLRNPHQATPPPVRHEFAGGNPAPHCARNDSHEIGNVKNGIEAGTVGTRIPLPRSPVV
jgi:hypothetical protein